MNEYSVERVQRKFLRFLLFLIDGIYPPRGTDCTLLSGICDMKSLFIQKLVHGIHVPQSFACFSATFAAPTVTTNVFRNAPTNRMFRIANSYFNDIFQFSPMTFYIE